MKIKILVLLLILSLLCGCGLAPSEESTSADPTASEEISGSPEISQNSENVNTPTEGNNGAEEPTNEQNPTDEQSSNGGDTSNNGSTSQSGSSEQTSQGETIVYEKYLAALSMYALVLEYPDFQLSTVYAASFVPMENKAQSKGIYVTFESGGMQLVAHLYPIEAERNESGARNVYSPEVGYAAFDIVSAVPDGLSTMSHDDYAAVMDSISMPTVTMY